MDGPGAEDPLASVTLLIEVVQDRILTAESLRTLRSNFS